MSLFIACLVIHASEMGWGWYVVAVFVWLLTRNDS